MPGRDGEFPVYYQLDVSTVACVAVKGAQQTTAVAIPAERFNQGQKDCVRQLPPIASLPASLPRNARCIGAQQTTASSGATHDETMSSTYVAMANRATARSWYYGSSTAAFEMDTHIQLPKRAKLEPSSLVAKDRAAWERALAQQQIEVGSARRAASSVSAVVVPQDTSPAVVDYMQTKLFYAQAGAWLTFVAILPWSRALFRQSREIAAGSALAGCAR